MTCCQVCGSARVQERSLPTSSCSLACVPTLLPSHPPGAGLASPERCGEGVLSAPEADGSRASTTLPQASPAQISARIPLLLPHPHGLGQTSASRPPSFDQYRASSQGGCRLHPPRRPQLSRGHMGEGLQPGSGALGGGAGQLRAGKAFLEESFIPSPTHTYAHSCAVHRYLVSTNYAPGLPSALGTQ